MSQVIKSQAMHLNQGNWAVAVAKTDQMEISCTTNRHVMTRNQPLTTVK